MPAAAIAFAVFRSPGVAEQRTTGATERALGLATATGTTGNGVAYHDGTLLRDSFVPTGDEKRMFGFLASNEARFVTGEVYGATGGRAFFPADVPAPPVIPPSAYEAKKEAPGDDVWQRRSTRDSRRSDM